MRAFLKRLLAALKRSLKPKPGPAPRPAPMPAPAPVVPPDGDVAGALLAAHNRVRQSHGKPPLALDVRLALAASRHAAYMAFRRTMAHDGIGDETPWERIKAVGYSYRAAAENVAKGQRDVAAVMAAWQNSAGHLANIVGPYSQMGAAMARDAGGVAFWTVDFGSPTAGEVGPRRIVTIRGGDGTTSGIAVVPYGED